MILPTIETARSCYRGVWLAKMSGIQDTRVRGCVWAMRCAAASRAAFHLLHRRKSKLTERVSSLSRR
jgi:hypothetical protein